MALIYVMALFFISVLLTKLGSVLYLIFSNSDEKILWAVFAWFLVVWLDGVCLQMFLFGVIILSTGSFHTVWNNVVNNSIIYLFPLITFAPVVGWMNFLRSHFK